MPTTGSPVSSSSAASDRRGLGRGLDVILGGGRATELAAIPSPPGDERAVADRLAAELEGFGIGLDEDDCGPRIGSSIWNLYGRVEGTAPGTPLFFCAHLDTVPPSGSIEPVVDDDGFVRNAAGGFYEELAKGAR